VRPGRHVASQNPRGDGGIKVRSGHVSNGVDHRHDEQSKGEGYADVDEAAAAARVSPKAKRLE
jgi:hypothetical protein